MSRTRLSYLDEVSPVTIAGVMSDLQITVVSEQNQIQLRLQLIEKSVESQLDWCQVANSFLYSDSGRLLYFTCFWWPFVKRFDLCYRTVVLFCLSCPVLTVEWIKVKLGNQVGLGPGHTVLDGDPFPLPQRGTDPQFLAHICCGQMARWSKMPSCHLVWR